jgi:mutator protein MutT
LGGETKFGCRNGAANWVERSGGVVREIREELGVEISVGKLFDEIAHDYPEKSVHLKFFLCRLLSGEPQPLDCAAVKWVEKDELADFEFPAADAQLLEKLRATPGIWR